MTEQELLQIATENLQDTSARIIACAADPAHLNIESKEMNELVQLYRNQLQLCFTLKVAFHEVKRKVR